MKGKAAVHHLHRVLQFLDPCAHASIISTRSAEGRSKTAPLHGKRVTLNVAALAEMTRALHRWLLAQPDTGDLSRPGIETLLSAFARGMATRFSLGREGFAVIETRAAVLRASAAGQETEEKLTADYADAD